MVASPLTGLVTALNNLIAGLARQLQQIADQGLIGGSAPAAAARGRTGTGAGTRGRGRARRRGTHPH